MTRKCSLVFEGDPGSYSACVPELPTILVTGRSLDEITARAREAIRVYRKLWVSIDPLHPCLAIPNESADFSRAAFPQEARSDVDRRERPRATLAERVRVMGWGDQL